MAARSLALSHEALRDHASRVRFVGTDVEVFQAYRDLIERVASKAYDAPREQGGANDGNGVSCSRVASRHRQGTRAGVARVGGC
jgi:hypothetical protein